VSKFLGRLIISGLALWVASLIFKDIILEGEPLQIAIVVLVFGFVNAIIKPIFKVLAFPLVILTLGIFILVINALLLLLTSAITSALDVRSFIAALGGSIVISIVSWALSKWLDDEED
jgi:putative membrane protein